ncbi:MAG TPA: tetratricopeptide repeat protein [Solirubrobacteraceae bacterium]|jgi:tetratricopeptide (TPR) repeat protein|nr:tetratricopeptide repeat protein [Solirubrobacteraceae bacterium]
MRFTNHRTTTLFLALLVMLAALRILWQLGGMDPRLHPKSPQSTAAFVRYMGGDYRSAADGYRSHLRSRVALYREHVDPLFAALVEGRTEDARRRAEEQLAHGYSADALLTLAELALGDGQPQAALETAQKVLQVDRDDYDAHLLSSVAHAHLRQYPAAVDDMVHALRQNRVERRATTFLLILGGTGDLGRLPSDGRPECLLAHYHRYLRIYDRSEGDVAIRHARRAIAANDQPDAAWVTIGLVARKQGKAADAFTAFQEAARLNPANPEALHQLALEYSDRGDLVNEARSYRAAFEAAPDDEYHAQGLFHITLKLGDYQQALGALRTAVARRPDSALLWGKLGEIEDELGLFPDSVAAHTRAVDLAPKNPNHRIRQGWALLKLERADAALASFREAVALDPYASDAYWGLGAAYSDLERGMEAQAAIERSFALQPPDRPDRVMALCSLYKQARDFPKTHACLQGVLRMDPKNQWALRWMRDVTANLPGAQVQR